VSIGLIRAESANAILVSRRRKIIEEGKAELSFATMLDLSTNNIKMMPEDSDLISDAFQMSRNASLSIYDLLYLSLAKKTNSALLSKDASQVKEAGRLGIPVERI
jgi:predicted nucleic acid-binding protein